MSALMNGVSTSFVHCAYPIRFPVIVIFIRIQSSVFLGILWSPIVFVKMLGVEHVGHILELFCYSFW